MTDVATWWQKVRADAEDDKQAVHDAYQHLENAGLISRVTVHRYICRRPGCGVLATVIRLGDDFIVRTRDNKQSPGLNRQRSVEFARKTRTLDGDRHWPGQTSDVRALAGVGIEASCRHGLHVVAALDVLAVVETVAPGLPQKPTLL